VNRKHCRGEQFFFENWKDITIGSPFIGKNKTKEKILNKS